MKNKAIIITGPTATGKTSLGADICRFYNGQLISADSRQVYTGLDIGTGKDLEDYQGEIPVEYHMIDICEPNDEFSLYEWRSRYIEYFTEITESKSLPVICGGTPLYLDMLLNDYELKGQKRTYSNEELEGFSLEELVARLKKEYPEFIDKTDLTQKARVLRALEIASSEKETQSPLPDCDYLILAPYWHRKVVHSRIEKRLKERWSGLIDEAKSLLDNGVSHERLEWFGLEYRYMSRFLLGDLSEKEAFEQLLIKIRQFAKRQDIWFRKMENKGHIIHWLTEDDKLSQAKSLIDLFLAGEDLPDPHLRISEITYGPRTQ
ncbi:MAG: tRNA (adenosine(37)-N6)-dimethylallyltransferase MiaA [Lentisphaeraceae bacterium]|nr:tRNA (adenosine(37)-N6)-dimethylallyltransferase MiaA [Lentisphaeraceae bacterium]